MSPELLVSPPETQTLLRMGLVTRFFQNSVEVALDGEIHTAIRTSGCVVDPRPGDLVVLFVPEGHLPVVLAIVDAGKMAESSPRTMNFPEGLVMNVSGRPLTLNAQNGLEIDSPETLIRSGRLSGQFSECEIVSDTLTLTGGVLSLIGEKVRHVAKSLERVAQWLHDRAHGSIREIETLDRHTSGETMIESESIVSIQSKTTLVASEELVKIDSDQIHLG
ncbi:MAG: DUF3540 domain-containing protein [Leptospirales bacterium]